MQRCSICMKPKDPSHVCLPFSEVHPTLEEIENTMKELMNDGLIEIVGHTFENGKIVPIYDVVRE